jgi:hypothetical protein
LEVLLNYEIEFDEIVCDMRLSRTWRNVDDVSG